MKKVFRLLFCIAVVVGISFSWLHKVDHHSKAESHCQHCILAKQTGAYDLPKFDFSAPIQSVFTEIHFNFNTNHYLESFSGFLIHLRGPPHFS